MPLTLAPIGPVTGGAVSKHPSGSGALQVFSKSDCRYSGGIAYFPHTPYSIYGTDGKRVRGIPNHAGDTDQRPTLVELPAGHYIVYADSDRFGQVTVPIVIAPSRVTLVYLEGPGMPEASGLSDAQTVRLPDGRPAGRRAEIEDEPEK
jgi:hypothetical protein